MSTNSPADSNQPASAGDPKMPNHRKKEARDQQPQTRKQMDEIAFSTVTDYLLKKGYRRTEEIFRQEVMDVDEGGKPRDGDPAAPDKILPAGKYLIAFKHFARWVDNGLDLYKFELGKFLWPLFIYSYLRLVGQGSYAHAQELKEQIRDRFAKTHEDELRNLTGIQLSQHVRDSEIGKAYLENQYAIPISKSLSGHLFHFLERELDQCGAVVLDILQQHCRIDAVDRGPIDPFSFEAIFRRARHQELDEADIQEGIPGFTHRGGLANRNILDNHAALKLGPLPMEPELRADVISELEEEDKLHPPREGLPTLVEEFNSMHPIKRESDDSPQRADIPYPPSRARDVVMEMQKARENRDRFRIEGRTGGIGPSVSVCFLTFHNHLGIVSSIDISKDQQLAAAGTSESFIRVWSLNGTPLKSHLASEKDLKVTNRKLFGHSGPVYSVAFSDAIANLERNIYDTEEQPETDSKILLSCSADGHVRLWSLDAWACLCIYKGHDGPVTSLMWNPHGHYFVTGGWDKTVRVWSQDHASAQRILIGHDTPISAVTYHPNGAYVFSASDETDKSIRMWSVVNGDCVRIFTGHVDYISAMECAPNGKIFASGDVGGNIYLWDIEKGTRIKRCRGHGRGGIWSLTFSVESNVLVSGGQDNTIRVWDVEMPAEGAGPANQQDGDGNAVAASGQPEGKQASQAAQPGTGAAGGTGKKKGKEVMVTPDQINVLPTKKTPVLKVQFSRMNLVIASGCYYPDLPEQTR
ncbi:transcription initiation factor TFIID subunit 5 [Hypoxylon sp. NC1633]|nr:transcription initiation factor TFIID subunit 5 [Hypoxylon sp. NC1633]